MGPRKVRSTKPKGEDDKTSNPSSHAIGTGQNKKKPSSREKLKNAQSETFEPLPVEAHPPPKPAVRIVDATRNLAATPGKLVLHPLRSAPSVLQVENRLARSKEQTRVQFFNVPIKIYDEFRENEPVDVCQLQLTPEDKADLEMYGCRIVMNQVGRVVAIEVDAELLDFITAKHDYKDLCRCNEYEHLHSDKLRTDTKTRKCFMAKVLTYETLQKLPAIVALYLQSERTSLHDFTYQQVSLFLFIAGILAVTRVATIFFAHVGHNEPCKSIITAITVVDNIVLALLFTTFLEMFSLIDEETTVKLKVDGGFFAAFELQYLRDVKDAKKNPYYLSYPFGIPLLVLDLCIVNMVLVLYTLVCPKKFNELGNFYLVIVFISSLGLGILAYFTIFYWKLFEKVGQDWDIAQLVMVFIITNLWTMWRYYYLQQIVRGTVLNINEKSAQFVSSTFAVGPGF